MSQWRLIISCKCKITSTMGHLLRSMKDLQKLTFLMQFNSDKFLHECTNNLYYLFASRDGWKLASFLLNSKLSMQAIDTFLSLDFVRVNYYWKHESLTFSSDSKFEVVIFHGIKAARIS